METQTVKGYIEEATVKSGNTNNKEWKRSVIKLNGKIFASFDMNCAQDIFDGKLKKGVPVEISYKTDGKYNNIVSILPAESKEIQPISSFQTADKIKNKEVDWEAISRGKVRHGVVTALIQKEGLIELTDDIVNKLENFVDYIMEGKKEKEGEIHEEPI